MIKLLLVDRQPEVVNAWKIAFEDLELLGIAEIRIGNFQDHAADMVVSPANSFGFMNGGIDYWYSEFFGWDLQDRVKDEIVLRFDGELLVGQALMVPTNHAQFPILISAPTMRLPMRIMDPVDVFLATRAALRCVRQTIHTSGQHDTVSVLFPGMGTGAGAVPPEMCASMMRKAYDAVFVGESFPTSWEEALKTTYGPRE